MTVNKKECKAIAVRPQPTIYKELKKEASKKGLTVANYCEEIINNRHNLIENKSNDNCIYKATIERYYLSSYHSIDDIKRMAENEKNEVYDGEDGYLDFKLISIEKMEMI